MKSRIAIAILFALLVALCAFGQMFQRSLPFLAKSGFTSVACTNNYDDFELYSAGDFIGGLNSGDCWTSPYFADRAVKDICVDTFETYTAGSDINGLNGGWIFYAPYTTSVCEPFGYDNFESYSAGSSVNNLNGGTGFTSPYISR